VSLSLADIALVRSKPGLLGHVASDPIASRVIVALAKDADRALPSIDAARARVRARAWRIFIGTAPPRRANHRS
jgi:hypothetical protein